MATYTAKATRDEGWWTVEVEEVPGLFTQTKRLDQIPDMVRDALTLFPEIEDDPASAEVIVVPQGELGQWSQAARAKREAADKARQDATSTMEETARAMYDQGIPYRDIGTLLGVSFQRAQTLTTV